MEFCRKARVGILFRALRGPTQVKSSLLIGATWCSASLSIAAVDAFRPTVVVGRGAATATAASACLSPTCLSSRVPLCPKFSLFEYHRFKLVSCNYARICLKGSFAYFVSAENGPAAITGSRLTYR